ncbi:hypothetical protein ROG8370_00078 [Roseovarius gaetbuli]|uniref:Glycosyl transferase family 2 n=1 Tax=Roseovarius gaetbuli TaxID=1356575 RepID=A0A1X6Y3K0_9RHOB|nr:hypothetical protein [Roseovarius gaetbuli]SLN09754.1 hypothetical protein ROG8370_00078 [Roseovarius gaetbuli]
MGCPIVTSIPPFFSRKDAMGQEIGDAHLSACIKSWRACGFEPVTVNAETEALHPLIKEHDVRVVRVTRDASEFTGRPHVFMNDLLNAALSLQSERIFIINADIELEMDETAKQRLANLGPTQAIGVRRRDYHGDNTKADAPYDGGIDLLGAGREALANIDCGQLIYGMPWWDHYLPLMLFWQNCEFLPGTGIKIWHLAHDGRWNKKQYIRSGQEFRRLLGAADPSLRQNAFVNKHVAELARIGRGHYGSSSIRALEARLFAMFLPMSKTHTRRVLRETSLYNTLLLNEIAGTRRDA